LRRHSAEKLLLDEKSSTGEATPMQSIRHLRVAATSAAILALAACGGPETLTADENDPQAAELAKATPKELPPAIVSSHAYRCKDNSLVYVDFMSDQKTAVFKATKDGSPTLLVAPEAGQAYVAEGYSLTGSGTNINLTRPGKGAQACKA
jgi:hypothetical protein